LSSGWSPFAASCSCCLLCGFVRVFKSTQMVALRMLPQEIATPMTPRNLAGFALPFALCPQSSPQLPCSPQRVQLPLDVLCPPVVSEPLKIDLAASFASLGALVPSPDLCADSTSFTAALDTDSLRLPPGLTPTLDAPSLGSVDHAAGVCRPCAWFWKRGGCKSGRLCTHCHSCPEGELKARRKAKVLSMRLGATTPKSDAGLQSPGTVSSPPPGLSLFDRSPSRAGAGTTELSESGFFAGGESSESETTTGTSSDGGDGSRTVSPQVPALPPRNRLDADVSRDVGVLLGVDVRQPHFEFSEPTGRRKHDAYLLSPVGSGSIPMRSPISQASKSKVGRFASKSRTSPKGNERVALSLVDCV